MKKNIAFILFSSLFLLVSCGGDNSSSDDSNNDSSSSSGSVVDNNPIKVNFYTNYSLTKTPYLKVSYPLGSKIEKPADPEATDPAYPDFVGWSIKTQINSESDLYDFDTVINEASTISLYGIWTKKDDGGGVTNELTVYTFKSDYWTGANMYAYSFAGEGESAIENASWPGEVMSLVNGSDWLYEYTVDLDTYTSIIFNDNASQTSDLSLSDASKDKPFYNVYTKVWSEVPSAKPDAPVSSDVTYNVTISHENAFSSGALIYAYIWGGDTGSGKWVECTKKTDTSFTFAVSSLTTFTGIKFVRFNPEGFSGPKWDDSIIWNQTGDLTPSENMTIAFW